MSHVRNPEGLVVLEPFPYDWLRAAAVRMKGNVRSPLIGSGVAHKDVSLFVTAGLPRVFCLFHY